MAGELEAIQRPKAGMYTKLDAENRAKFVFSVTTVKHDGLQFRDNSSKCNYPRIKADVVWRKCGETAN